MPSCCPFDVSSPESCFQFIHPGIRPRRKLVFVHLYPLVNESVWNWTDIQHYVCVCPSLHNSGGLSIRMNEHVSARSQFSCRRIEKLIGLRACISFANQLGLVECVHLNSGGVFPLLKLWDRGHVADLGGFCTQQTLCTDLDGGGTSPQMDCLVCGFKINSTEQ